MAGVMLYTEYLLSHVRQYTSAILYTEYLLSHVSLYTSGMTRYVGMSTNGVMVWSTRDLLLCQLNSTPVC